jgi:hypothetical protein
MCSTSITTRRKSTSSKNLRDSQANSLNFQTPNIEAATQMTLGLQYRLWVHCRAPMCIAGRRFGMVFGWRFLIFLVSRINCTHSNANEDWARQWYSVICDDFPKRYTHLKQPHTIVNVLISSSSSCCDSGSKKISFFSSTPLTRAWTHSCASMPQYYNNRPFWLPPPTHHSGPCQPRWTSRRS